MSDLILPFAGRQEEFLSSDEFEVLTGGAKGGAKSLSLILSSLRQVHRAKYKALILRKTFKGLDEIKLRTHEVCPLLGGTWNENDYQWTFPSGSILELGYCLTLDDAERYHGREFAFIGYDEITQLPSERVWTQLLAENRSPDPSITRMMRCTANPIGPGVPWIKRRFLDPCGYDGAHIYRYAPNPDKPNFTLSRRFIPSRVTDNPVYANDALYMAQLHSLPERQRRLLLEGDWSAAEGALLDELAWDKHWLAPDDPKARIEKHWMRFAAFDWGFAHPWAFVVGVTDEQGRVIVEDTLWGRRQYDDEICDDIRNWTSEDGGRMERSIRYIVAGHDCWQEHRARDQHTPSTAETFAKRALPLMKANIDRRQGVNVMRNFLAWRRLGPNGGDGEPHVHFLPTPGNRRLFEQCEQMVPDPLDLEKPLKQDANDEGEGGDDGFDALRYLLSSRPMPSPGAPPPPPPTRNYDDTFDRMMSDRGERNNDNAF